jgi:hypothetical protein
MPKLTFFGPSRFHDAAQQAASGRLINCYREVVGGRSSHVLRSVLSTVDFGDMGAVFLRAMEEVNGSAYAVAGGYLHEIASNGIVTQIGAIADGPDTVISGNNGDVTVTANGNYYVWDGTTLSQPSAGAFSSFGSHDFLGNFTILTEKNGRRVQISDAADASTLGGLNFVTTEINDSNNVRIAAISGNAWVFKEEAIEILALDGAGSLTPIPSATIEKGIKDFRLFTKLPNGAAFVATDNSVYLAGQQVTPISTPFVEESIRAKTPTHMFYYEDAGHKMLVLRFSDRMAWTYDLAGQEWHERGEDITLDPWSIVNTIQAYGKQIAGSDVGGLFTLERVNADADAPLLRRAIGTLDFEDMRRSVPEIVIRGESGSTSSTHSYDDPVRCWLRLSKDNGRTWGVEKWRDFGALGDYRTRAVWRANGAFKRSLTIEFNMTDPVDFPVDCDALVEVA